MRKKKRLAVIGALLTLLMALGLTLYPLISNIINEKYASEIHTSYETAIAETDQEALVQTKALATAYNEALVPGLSYSQEALQAASEDYNDLLNVLGNGTMGYIQIPKINVLLPILHGTDTDTLEQGVGHLLGSSLPVGGLDTHTILSGHSGMASRTMFTDLEQLEMGDIFYLQVLGEILAYQVTQINIVLPTDSSRLQIISGKDLCTLVTCTPYATNTHRLLVTGERIPYEIATELEADTPTAATSTWMQKYISGLLWGILIAVSCGLIFIAVIKIRKFYIAGAGHDR